jgi:hypothetical protein
MVSKLSEIWSGLFIPDQDHDFLPIPDPGVKKAPDPGSGPATLLQTIIFNRRIGRLSYVGGGGGVEISGPLPQTSLTL